MKTKIYHTENAGLFLMTPHTGILIDGIHGAEKVGFSPMPEKESRQIEEKEGLFEKLDGLLFTHLHVDHFKAKKVTEFLLRRPDTAVWGPGLEKRHLHDYTEENGNIRFAIGDFRIHAYPTDHSGKLYQKEPHMSLLVRNGQENEAILAAGDAVFYPEQAERIMEDAGKVDAVFVMFYQLVEESSLQFLEKLDPGRIFLYHCPAPEDDTYGQLPLIRQVVKRGPLPGRMIEVPEHHSWI